MPQLRPDRLRSKEQQGPVYGTYAWSAVCTHSDEGTRWRAQTPKRPFPAELSRFAHVGSHTPSDRRFADVSRKSTNPGRSRQLHFDQAQEGFLKCDDAWQTGLK